MSASQATLFINGVPLVADLTGALFWPERRTLVVADLHLEKGSAFAARGRLLPPYDSTATLDRLETAVAAYAPDRVVCLGDSFHDRRAAERLAAEDVARLRQLASAYEWIWIAGNHDPVPPTDWGGTAREVVTIGPLSFRHIAEPGAVGELSGHYHPKAAVRVRGARVTARCFVGDGRRLILPAFGAYAGGLNVLDRAVAPLFDREFTVHMLGDHRIHAFPRARLAPEPARSGSALRHRAGT